MNEATKIQEIVKHACNSEGIAKRCPQRIADALISAGYGNVREAVNEFAEWVIIELYFYGVQDESERHFCGSVCLEELSEEIRAKVKELYGEEQNNG